MATVSYVLLRDGECVRCGSPDFMESDKSTRAIAASPPPPPLQPLPLLLAHQQPPPKEQAAKPQPEAPAPPARQDRPPSA
jgi:hypothetical protein